MGEGYLVLVLVIFTICRTDGASLWGREHLEKHYNLTPARREAKPDCSRDLSQGGFQLVFMEVWELGKEANEWLAQKKPPLPLILLACEMRGAGVALFSSWSEIAEWIFLILGSKPHAFTSEMKLAGWFLLAGLGENAFIFACLTFVPSPSVCPLERLWIWHSCKSQTLSSKSQPYPQCLFCTGMQVPGNGEIHPACERWMQHRSPGGCTGIPASHAGWASCREPCAGGKQSWTPWQLCTWLLHLRAINQHQQPLGSTHKTQLSFKCEMKSRWVGEQQKQHHKASNPMGGEVQLWDSSLCSWWWLKTPLCKSDTPHLKNCSH